ncbi:hypothetical protein [Pedosphaera parvula]|uniref:Uncharacterized protein n=1 Tax=Pedosphaera parvula (strain Ellin514) TaxID=320771 RepID=B9XH76_PEDPL|nr:hypothetical protein [Pedosphaera parvula]EEF60711.1 hypothetical protein Cflav_PD3569 [Pedosphaera parvula Ellin514]
MDLPRQFAYGPQWKFIFYFFVAGIALLALAGVHFVSPTVGIALSFLPLCFALVGTVRRLVFPRFLELGQDTFSVCTGFFQARVTRIPYADIEQAWEVVGPRMTIFHLRTKDRTTEILSILLPNMTSYVAVRDFVNSRVRAKEKKVQPIEDGKYCFRCSYEGDGEIYNSNGEIIWRFKTLHARPHYPYGFFRLPDFVVHDNAGKELFRIKLERKWALAEFEMLENGLPVSTIRQRSILRNKFTLDFVNGHKWVFRMPLFTVSFGGLSETGEAIRVRLHSHNVWYVLIDPKADNPQLVVALAFIHRERLRFN